MGLKDLNFKAEIGRLNPTMRNVVLAGLLLLLVVSLGCFVEDYNTTVAGLGLLPGRAVNDWLRPLLGMAPQAMQVVFMFMAITQRNKVAGGITLLAWAFDFWTDYIYRSHGLDPTPENVITVAFFCFMVATFFSEFMLVFTLQHVAFAVGPALGGWWAGFKGVWRDAVKAAREASLLDETQRMLYPTDERGNGTAKKTGGNGTAKKASRRDIDEEPDREYSGRGMFEN